MYEYTVQVFINLKSINLQELPYFKLIVCFQSAQEYFN